MDNNSEKLIKLTFRREDFEEIYFSTSKGNVYYNPIVKNALITFLCLATIFSMSLYQSILHDTYIVLTVMSFLFLLPVCFNYFYNVYHLWKEKQSIDEYLDALASSKNHEVLLTQQAICITQDKTVTLEKWSVITKASLHQDYISFEGQQIFLFPKKSMAETDFEYFKNLVAEKIKNG